MASSGRRKDLSGASSRAISVEKLRYETALVSSLKPNPRNARLHSKRQIDKSPIALRNSGSSLL